MNKTITLDEAKKLAKENNINELLESTIKIDDIEFTIKQTANNGDFYVRLGNIQLMKPKKDINEVLNDIEYPNWRTTHIIAITCAEYVLREYIDNYIDFKKK